MVITKRDSSSEVIVVVANTRKEFFKFVKIDSYDADLEFNRDKSIYAYGRVYYFIDDFPTQSQFKVKVNFVFLESAKHRKDYSRTVALATFMQDFIKPRVKQ